MLCGHRATDPNLRAVSKFNELERRPPSRSIGRFISIDTDTPVVVREPPDHCPQCGTALDPLDPPRRFACPTCEETVPHHPIPVARLAVIDGDDLLLVKVDHPDRHLWGTPGGHVEADEHPHHAGARELAEETTLQVDPDDLALFDARTFPKFGEVYKTYLCYAVNAADVSGSPTADHEVAQARFWAIDDFQAADDRLLTSWPAAYKDITWWIEQAQTALDS